MTKLGDIAEEELTSKGGTDYLKLKVGDNQIRIVTEFAKRVQHFQKGDCLGQGCPNCVGENSSPSAQYLCWVIDRTDGVIKIAQFGMGVMKMLKALSSNPQYKFDVVPPFDITINRVGTTKEDTKYTLLPDRADTPLTVAENEAILKLESPAKLVVMFLNAQKKKLGMPTASEIQGTTEDKQVDVKDIPF